MRILLMPALVALFGVAIATPISAVPVTTVTEPPAQVTAGDQASAVSYGHAAPTAPGGVGTEALPAGYQFWNLQLNLCNSGFASCYEGGQAVPEAQQVIAAWRPDVVTLNEICLPDVRDRLFATLQQAWPNDWVFWAFMPAWNVAQNAPYQCANGRGQYGNAIMGHVLADDWAGLQTFGGIYQSQAAGANEWRSWVCAYAVGNYYGCATHLAAGNGTAAMLQCVDLLSSIVPGLWNSTGRRPSVVGGDFNLKYGGSPNIQNCVPSGWFRKGDGDVQHWFVTNDFRFDFSREIALQHTDHPGWLVALRAP